MDVRSLQRPLKEQYRREPSAAGIFRASDSAAGENGTILRRATNLAAVPENKYRVGKLIGDSSALANDVRNVHSSRNVLKNSVTSVTFHHPYFFGKLHWTTPVLIVAVRSLRCGNTLPCFV